MIAKFSKGGWSACQDGKCSCKGVWADDYPVADVAHGEWGDTYPAVRVVGNGIMRQYEAIIEKIPYGFIPEEVAVANAQVIAKATDSYEQMIALVHLHWTVRQGKIIDGTTCEWAWMAPSGDEYKAIGPIWETPAWPEEARKFIETWLENNAENA